MLPDTREGSFKDVSNSFIRLVDDRPGTSKDELARYKLDGSIEDNGLIFASIHRIPEERGGGWKMNAIGESAPGRRATAGGFRRALLAGERGEGYKDPEPHLDNAPAGIDEDMWDMCTLQAAVLSSVILSRC